MMLLQLPTELIQLILRNCDTPGYFQAAFSSRRLYEIASTSREAIIHRLHHTPGYNDIEGHPTKYLFSELMKRSYEQLDGAEHYAKPTYEFQRRVIDCRASTLETSKDSLRALLVFKGYSTVHLLNIGNRNRPEVELTSPGQDIGKIEIIQTAFDGKCGVYVLHRFLPSLDRELDMNHPFVKQALESHPNGSIHLAYHHLDPQKNAIHMLDFPEWQGYRPLALAATDDKFAISWQNTLDPLDYHVVLYAGLRDEDEDEDEDHLSDNVTEQGKKDGPPKIIHATCEACVLSSSTGQDTHVYPSQRTGPVVKLTFNDRGFQLLYHYRAQNVYGDFQRIHHLPGRGQGEHRPRLNANACTVQFSPSLSLQFSIGIPFFGTHEFGDPDHGGRCHWQYLAFGIATHRVEQWTVACLLKSETYTGRRCTHLLNLGRGRRFDHWQIVAQLGGFRELTTSQGSRVATSRRGTRIAVANWKTLYVWALNPFELIEGNRTGYYPPSWESSTSAIELRPVVIQLEAVCSQLRFTEKEDELVAITDHGLMYLPLGYSGNDKRLAES
ncbi:uncharacterized protein N7515_001858 [Penicillium bovifimosum]|uniref:F-box domain-containing protein n=1 Tax=Penicillium bovifimosum TaxID=126998 RepID=A0A9W9L8S7_9EURO|nr:uncharacterized protein N7515_001858 [Penicillium bovifimosum]KAJ5143071.1 hypothetical protein N7515_001858 [Penicillium bovifimosum]